jgi:hypothetical protein
MIAVIITPGVVLAFILLLAIRTVRVAPHASAGVVSRLGRYKHTVEPGLSVLPVRRLANAPAHGRRAATSDAMPAGWTAPWSIWAIESPRQRSTDDALLDQPAQS